MHRPIAAFRPAAAYSILSNERGSACEDTFALREDVGVCGVACPLFGVYDGWVLAWGSIKRRQTYTAALPCMDSLGRCVTDRTT